MTNDKVEELIARAERAGLISPRGSAAIAAIYRASRLAEVFERLQRKSLDFSRYTLEENGLMIVLLIGEGLNFTPKQLAEAVFVSPANMTAKLSRLEKSGRIERQLNPDDRRSVVKLTDAGREEITRNFLHLSKRADEMMSPLSDDEIDQFSALLTKLLLAYGDKGETVNKDEFGETDASATSKGPTEGEPD